MAATLLTSGAPPCVCIATRADIASCGDKAARTATSGRISLAVLALICTALPLCRWAQALNQHSSSPHSSHLPRPATMWRRAAPCKAAPMPPVALEVACVAEAIPVAASEAPRRSGGRQVRALNALKGGRCPCHAGKSCLSRSHTPQASAAVSFTLPPQLPSPHIAHEDH